MATFDDKVEALLAKHDHLSKEEAVKIITEKNDRKKQRRSDKNDRIQAKRLKREEERSQE